MATREQMQKLIALEKQAARKSGFRQGLMVGFFIPVLLFSFLMITLLFSRSYLERKAGEFIVSSVMTEVFSSFPDAYFTNNRERIIQIFDDFTNAASNHKISSAEFNAVGRKFLAALQDKRLTYAELDQILETMHLAAQ